MAWWLDDDEVLAAATAVWGDDPACPVCGNGSIDALVSMLEYHRLHPVAGACGYCAAIIANVFNMKHGGQWLTPGLFGFPANDLTGRPRRVTFSHARRMRIFERDGYRCQAPGCESQHDLTIDHRLAVANGGTNDDDNLQTMCRPCNLSKGARKGWSGRKAEAS